MANMPDRFILKMASVILSAKKAKRLKMSKQNVLLLQTGYLGTGKNPVLVPPTNQQLEILSAKVANESGGASNLGVGRSIAQKDFKVFRIVDASTPKGLDVTNTIQSGGSVNLFTTTANDGFSVGSIRKFSSLIFTVTQANTGAPVYVYRYFNGSSLVTLTGITLPTSYTAIDMLLVFNPPNDWAKGGPAGFGLDPDMFHIVVTASTAPDQAVISNSVQVLSMFQIKKAVADKGELLVDLSATEGLILQSGEGIVPYFSNSNADNNVQVVYRIQK